MAVTAVTGDIGAGKSTAARLFAQKLSCELLDADVLAKELWLREDVKAQAVSRWGEGILDSSGRINMSKIAGLVFMDKANHEFCNALIHPLVMSRLEELSRNLNHNSVLEIPLLFEAGRPSWITRAVYVTADFRVRAERRKAQRGWSTEELLRRESFLLPSAKKIDMCEFVIHNDGSLSELQDQIDRIIQEITHARDKDDGRSPGTQRDSRQRQMGSRSNL